MYLVIVMASFMVTQCTSSWRSDKASATDYNHLTIYFVGRASTLVKKFAASGTG
jgi:hypothetical protein